MPNGAIDIFIDSSFYAVSSGSADAAVNLSFIEADNIGLRTIETEYETIEAESVQENIYSEYFVTDTVYSGFTTIDITSNFKTTESGTRYVDLSYNIPTSISGGFQSDLYIDLVYFAEAVKQEVSYNIKNYYTAGAGLSVVKSFPVDYRTVSSSTVYLDYPEEYTAGGEYDPLIPIPGYEQVTNSGIYDARQYFTMGHIIGSSTNTAPHEVYFAGYPMTFYPEKYTYRFHLTAGDEGTKNASYWDLSVISGSVLDMQFEAVAGVSGTNYYNSEVICGVSGTQYIEFNADMITGGLTWLNKEVVCGVSGTGGFGFNVDLFSLKISNFSLEESEYTPASGTICVDVTDDVYNVVTSGTYFVFDGTTVSGISYTPITNGYRMCYDPDDDFTSLVGSTEILVHAENDNGDSLEVAFYLTSGYIVEYDTKKFIYDYDKQVVVRGSAENLAGCPEVGTDAYWFTTVPRLSKNLGATIVGVPWGESDLSAQITPTTDTIFFYGKVFRIEVRASDLAGNEMEPYIFEFKIEDKPE